MGAAVSRTGCGFLVLCGGKKKKGFKAQLAL
jgi:hypothetical protein